MLTQTDIDRDRYYEEHPEEVQYETAFWAHEGDGEVYEVFIRRERARDTVILLNDSQYIVKPEVLFGSESEALCFFSHNND